MGPKYTAGTGEEYESVNDGCSVPPLACNTVVCPRDTDGSEECSESQSALNQSFALNQSVLGGYTDGPNMAPEHSMLALVRHPVMSADG